MHRYRHWLRPVGVLLLLPLAAVLGDGTIKQAGCDLSQCGDEARGTFVLMVATAAPAATGLLLLVVSTAGPRRRRFGRLGVLTTRLGTACVALSVLVLAGTLAAVTVSWLTAVTTDPPPDIIGPNGEHLVYYGGPWRSESFYLGAVVLLTPMTIVAVLALWAAWRKRRVS
jgi:hypothetical protein